MEEKEWIKKGMEFWEKKDYEHAVECFREGDKAGELGCKRICRSLHSIMRKQLKAVFQWPCLTRG